MVHHHFLYENKFKRPCWRVSIYIYIQCIYTLWIQVVPSKEVLGVLFLGPNTPSERIWIHRDMYFHFHWLALHPMNVPHNTCREARHHQGRSHLLSLFLKGDTKRYEQKWTDNVGPHVDEKHWKTIGNGKLTKRNRHLMRFIEDLDIYVLMLAPD